MDVFPLFEGTYSVDTSKTFVPFDLLKDKPDDRPGSLIVDIVPFLIKTENDLIVIDPGLGFLRSEVSKGFSGEDDFQIHHNIRNTGFAPEEVSVVLLSHLHKDHAAGICYGRNGAFNLMFPSANYFCQKKELEYAFTKKDSPSYVSEKLTFLSSCSNLKFLDNGSDPSPGIHCIISGGHTPYHQVFLIEVAGKRFFFGGDVLPQPSQVLRRFVAKYDYDGKLSYLQREEYATRGAAEDWTFLFFHDSKTPVSKIRKDGKHFTLIQHDR